MEPLDQDVTVPNAVKLAVEKLVGNSVGAEKSWLVVKRTSWKRCRNRNETYENRKETLSSLIKTVKDNCTLSGGLCCGSIWKGGESAWNKDGSMVLKSLRKGIEKIGVNSFDL